MLEMGKQWNMAKGKDHQNFQNKLYQWTIKTFKRSCINEPHTSSFTAQLLPPSNLLLLPTRRASDKAVEVWKGLFQI